MKRWILQPTNESTVSLRYVDDTDEASTVVNGLLETLETLQVLPDPVEERETRVVKALPEVRNGRSYPAIRIFFDVLSDTELLILHIEHFNPDDGDDIPRRMAASQTLPRFEN